MITSFLGVAILGYVFGSLPIHRFLGLPDFDAPGTHASFLRNTSRFLVNISKGLLVVHIAEQFGPPEAMIAAFAVAFGHNYPLWPNFRGGIGMGVLLGAMLALDPSLGLCALSSWLLAFYVFQRTTIAGLSAAVATPLAASMLSLPYSALALFPMTALVLWRHRKIWGQLFDFGPKPTEDAFRGL